MSKLQAEDAEEQQRLDDNGCTARPSFTPCKKHGHLFCPICLTYVEPTRVAAPRVARKRLLEDTSEMRKKYPITTGLLDYFPDACAYVALVSFKGNEKHNPGEPLHWARGKSMDHPDCMARHLIERGGMDGEILHSGNLAWRALANLQEELEALHGLATPRGATDGK